VAFPVLPGTCYGIGLTSVPMAGIAINGDYHDEAIGTDGWAKPEESRLGVHTKLVLRPAN